MAGVNLSYIKSSENKFFLLFFSLEVEGKNREGQQAGSRKNVRIGGSYWSPSATLQGRLPACCRVYIYIAPCFCCFFVLSFKNNIGYIWLLKFSFANLVMYIIYNNMAGVFLLRLVKIVMERWIMMLWSYS